jgi:hypothetical protein
MKFIIKTSLYYNARSEKHQIMLNSQLLGIKSKKNEMGGAYGTYGRHKGCIQGMVGDLRDRDRL